MNRKSLVATADAVAVGRPDWNQPGIISALQVLAHTWQGTDAALLAHVFAVAAMPTALTPAAINAMPVQPGSVPSTGQSKEPTCFICARSRDDCRKLHDFEVRHPGIRDPHIFETHEEADANRADYQVNDRDSDRALVPLGAALDKVAEQSPERAAAKARARAAVDQARQKSVWKPAPPPSERRIQEQDQPKQEASTA